MTEPVTERLYALLPAIYRQRDRQQGWPLRALLATLEDQFQTLLADTEALYDNWFVETADDWVVPYLAELVGIRDMADTRSLRINQRRRVANTIGYRRRKGSLATLEHVAQDVSGWSVYAVEYDRQLSMTQHLTHVRQTTGRTGDVHQAGALDALGGPFDNLPHTTDVRSIRPSGSEAVPGRYRPDQVGLFVWRLKTYPSSNSPPRPIVREFVGGPALPPGSWKFDALGHDVQLFNEPQELVKITDWAAPINLPHPLSRAAFAADLNKYETQYRDLDPQYRPPNSTYYGPDRSVYVTRNGTLIRPHQIVSADLSQWHAPVLNPDQSTGKALAIDAILGRMLWLVSLEPDDDIEVSYSYGFSGDLGGGPYSRYLTLAQPQPGDPDPIYVSKGSQTDTLAKALARWQENSADQPRGIIQLMDNGVYVEPNLTITLPENAKLIIQAADGVRPVLVPTGGWTIQTEHANASLTLNGLLIDGKLEIDSGLNLVVSHCTLLPHGLTTQADEEQLATLQVSIDHSIVGPVRLPGSIVSLSVSNSILDHAAGYAISGPRTAIRPGPVTSLQHVTIFGKVHVQQLQSASGVIFTAPVLVQDVSAGLVSFSYVPAGSRTPRRDQCVPAEVSASSVDAMDIPQRPAAIHPVFTSTRYRDPGYAQLSPYCPTAIWRGAEDGSEMGAFHDLFQAQRQDNLDGILDEYLPFGLSAGIIYVT